MSRKKQTVKCGRLHASAACAIEALESRLLLSTYMVTNHRDIGPGSLRDATQQSNANPGTNTITFAVTGTITLTGTQLEISNDVNITGPGASSLTISGGNMSRVFQIDAAANVSISGLTVTGGHTSDGIAAVTGSHGAGAGGDGGGIYNTGSLTLTQDVIANNVCGNGGAAGSAGYTQQPGQPPTFFNGAPAGTGGNGGGIYSSGVLNINQCTIETNTGGIGGKAGSWNSGANGGPSGQGGSGGGIYSTGSLSVVASTIDSNVTGLGGEGDRSTGSPADAGDGGGIAAPSGTVTVMNSTVSTNHTGNFGLYITPFPIALPGGSGAAILANNLSLFQCTISGNILGVGTSFSGSGLHTPASAIDVLDLRMTNCTVSGNDGSGLASGTVVVRVKGLLNNTIVAGNTGTANQVSGTPPVDVVGSLDPASSHNVIGSGGGLTTGVNGNVVGVTNAPFSPLGNYGGQTQTMIPLPGNWAIANGNIALAVGPDGLPLNTDQRGLPRTVDGTIDIGAVEIGPPTFPLVVTTTADTLDSNWSATNLSLREAMGYATILPGPHTITFAPGVSGTITLNGALGALQLGNISGKMSVDGPGETSLSVVGGLFQVANGVTADIEGLSLSSVLNLGSLAIANCDLTAEVQNRGNLSLTNSTYHVVSSSGVLAMSDCKTAGFDLNTNGINVETGSANVARCTIAGVGSSADTTVTVSDSSIKGAGSGATGIVFSAGRLTLINCSITNGRTVNVGTLTVEGGAIGGSAAGGLANEASATISGCTITGSQALAGGGIFNDKNATMSLSDCTISNNSATGATAISGGGGVENLGTLTVAGCTISGNTCTPASAQSPAAVGGGIDNAGTAALFNCTISGNTVSNSSTTGAFASGGGINNSGNLRLTNCTVSGNAANAGTGAENDAAGGGIYIATGHVTLDNTIVAGNHSMDPSGLLAPDVYGAIDSSSAYNLVGVGDGMTGLSAANHNQIGTVASPLDPKLGLLADNGGPTQTMALLAGSPAIDAGSNALATGPDGKPLLTDQRGYARIFNGTVNIGAYEFGSAMPGDFDGDGKIDFSDLVILARHYGQSVTSWTNGDANGDGSVGFDDLVIVARNYGKSLAAAAAVFAASQVKANSHLSP